MNGWIWKFEQGDEVIVDGELLYVEKRVKKKWYTPLARNYWRCYDGYGEDRIVSERQMIHKPQD